ncbi:hypothetical protein SNOG_20017 [Parastagonospora nodorum SN15]|uniref:Uncharacterized protein n=1 Tax=Phaeosphaeria nodorum (strain SN15 / ATCC MYA-4574 / FGSC 10173) TaxID=321614 RepID=A9JX14_PHANO|nr:hypothetical protein SNOG_20017 [Parastagonospora nodorum SN15]EDP89842.1 hypothetical protein SNOG_20017 [Parastagonospora nodorum SN15]
MTSAAEKPDPMTSNGSCTVSNCATGASDIGGGILTENVPDANTKCLHRIPNDPIMNPSFVLYTPSTFVSANTASAMPTASGYALK